MSEITFLVTRCEDGGYEARSLDSSIFTCAPTLKELRRRIGDALACHFEEWDCPKTYVLRMVQDEDTAR